MDYDAWLFKQADDAMQICEYDPDDIESWCDCTICTNRRKQEYKEAEAEAQYEHMCLFGRE